VARPFCDEAETVGGTATGNSDNELEQVSVPVHLAWIANAELPIPEASQSQGANGKTSVRV
jgi:hypothetical protein